MTPRLHVKARTRGQRRVDTITNSNSRLFYQCLNLPEGTVGHSETVQPTPANYVCLSGLPHSRLLMALLGSYLPQTSSSVQSRTGWHRPSVRAGRAECELPLEKTVGMCRPLPRCTAARERGSRNSSVSVQPSGIMVRRCAEETKP